MTLEEVTAKLDALSARVDELVARVDAPRPSPYAKVREACPNAGKPWSKADDEELRRLFAAGNSVDDLALLFGRTKNGVKVRLERLGVLQPESLPAA